MLQKGPVMFFFYVFLPLNLIGSGILVWYSHQSQSKNIHHLEFDNIFGVDSERGQRAVYYTSRQCFLICWDFYSMLIGCLLS